MASCGDALILFDRGLLARLDLLPVRLLGSVEARGPRLSDLRGGCPGPLSLDVDKTFQVADVQVRFVGTRATTCRT